MICASQHRAHRRPPERRADDHRAALGLVRSAAVIRRAAATGDVDALHAGLAQLRTDLLTHLHAGQGGVAALPDHLARIVADGRRRLLGSVDEVLLLDDDATGDCGCPQRAASIDAALRRQLRLERALGVTVDDAVDDAVAGAVADTAGDSDQPGDAGPR